MAVLTWIGNRSMYYLLTAIIITCRPRRILTSRWRLVTYKCLVSVSSLNLNVSVSSQSRQVKVLVLSRALRSHAHPCHYRCAKTSLGVYVRCDKESTRWHTCCEQPIAGTWTRWAVMVCTGLRAPTWTTAVQREHRPPACWCLSHRHCHQQQQQLGLFLLAIRQQQSVPQDSSGKSTSVSVLLFVRPKCTMAAWHVSHGEYANGTDRWMPDCYVMHAAV